MEKEIKLNLGSGPTGINGWLNYDWGVLPLLSKFPKIQKIIGKLGVIPKEYIVSWPKIKLVNIKKKLPLADNSVSYIYCSHVFEHFELWQTISILKECYRVLLPGGIIRVIVPDLKKLISIYESKGSGVRAGRDMANMWWGFEKDKEPKTFLQRLGRCQTREHQWSYDKEELEYVIGKAGFKDIKEVSIFEGRVPDIEKLDQPYYQQTSVFMEGVKR